MAPRTIYQSRAKVKVTLTAEGAAKIDTWVHVMNNKMEKSLPGESDAVRLGIVKLDLKGSTEEIMARVSYLPKPNPPSIVLFQVSKHKQKSTRT